MDLAEEGEPVAKKMWPEAINYVEIVPLVATGFRANEDASRYRDAITNAESEEVSTPYNDRFDAVDK